MSKGFLFEHTLKKIDNGDWLLISKNISVIGDSNKVAVEHIPVYDVAAIRKLDVKKRSLFLCKLFDLLDKVLEKEGEK